MLKTYRIELTGRVQGVGFRPFVYNLSQRYKLKGSVSNNENGVVIFLTGKSRTVLQFYGELLRSPPPVSMIKKHEIKEIDFKLFDDFRIVPSSKNRKLNLILTPDFAICDDCKKELKDRRNRRYRYAFTTCVNCGPRWSVTKTFPFERSHTSIEAFKMCAECNQEYTDPANRRFHSQTNTCSECGIRLSLYRTGGEEIPVSQDTIFTKTAGLIKQGNIIAIKNTGGYLLCCDANNAKSILRLRKLKRRPRKAFAILYPGIELLESHQRLQPEQKKALKSSVRPIVIIPKKGFKGKLAFDAINPGLNQIGVMLPYSGVLELLAEALQIPIVATSGNIHGSPIISNREEAEEQLGGVADYFLHHNLEITNPQDDSVVKFSAKHQQEVLFRRSRGYAPNYFNFSEKNTKKIMAMGGGLKSTLAFTPNDNLYISQYLGDLENYSVYERFTKIATYFTRLFETEPEVILTDRHPGYQSGVYGENLAAKTDAEIYKIQHHKAHFASVLGEHRLFDAEDPILGVIWDGTGYGDDGQIWGGEFFIYANHKIDRITHFDYFDWLAGDKMSAEPRISLFSLADAEIEKGIRTKFSQQEWNIYRVLKQKNHLKTASVGRLFDAVASLLDICDHNSYEGEAAILLENQISDYDLSKCKSYLSIPENLNVDTYSLIQNSYNDLKSGTPKTQIIQNFLFTLSGIVLQIAEIKKIKKIALSGGVFQNTVLIDMLKDRAGNDFELFFNINLAPNDENISFGQIMYHLNISET